MIYSIAMISYFIIAALLAVGLTAFFRAINSAAEGYEDEYGFHSGNDPQLQMSFAVATRAIAKDASPIVAVKVRQKRLFKPEARDSVSQSSSAPFPIA
jgi:hypothetical protein